jgi:hypothetical protein
MVKKRKNILILWISSIIIIFIMLLVIGDFSLLIDVWDNFWSSIIKKIELNNNKSSIFLICKYN